MEDFMNELLMFENYVVWTDTTATYPDAGTGKLSAVAYLALALIGEIEELVSAVNTGNDADIVAEAGDVLWYVARFVRECHIYEACIFNAHDEARYVDSVLAVIGDIANTTKKQIRYYGYNDTPSSMYCDKLTEWICFLYNVIADRVSQVNSTMEDVLKHNMQKLDNRKTSGTINSVEHRENE